jgi:hypothetical protein
MESYVGLPSGFASFTYCNAFETPNVSDHNKISASKISLKNQQHSCTPLKPIGNLVLQIYNATKKLEVPRKK